MTAKTPKGASPRRLPRLLRGAALLLGLLAAGHALAWTLITRKMEARFLGWAEARRAQGWEVAHGPPRRGGWPFAATLELPGWRLALPQGPVLQGEALRLSLSPGHWDRLLLCLEGAQNLRIGTAELPFRAHALVASLPLLGQGDVPLRGEALQLGPPSGAVSIARLEGTLEGVEAARRLRLALRGIALPVATPMGPEIAAATLDAALNGPVPPPAPLAQRAAAWRDAGGALELRGLTLQWGGATASLAATLGLDAALQPAGSGTLRLAGAEHVLDALVQAGVVPQRNAALARGLLPLMQRPDPAGGPPVLEVPVALENRGLSVARLNLGRVPAVEWE
ncbi:DUF2125 domain-containing protein [Roseomonas sp. GC11]|uniref:DUF2125 domain-containing protein n=1 Tax=Roseomonas sp. GC11 TaxID=2950546 RepID=UPI002109219B|nr:DUF2125 domain-containing protein [Roseomonas sp. GC11]MCQ4162811.1 DUF2125 domain-containing protein [Roseomonas sp. GC11]